MQSAALVKQVRKRDRPTQANDSGGIMGRDCLGRAVMRDAVVRWGIGGEGEGEGEGKGG